MATLSNPSDEVVVPPNQVVTRVLNLYAGIGGNRKLWENVEVTAAENVQAIADIYKDFFPDDTVIVADAHQYLLDHYKEYDFIWSSPPCQSHSDIRFNKGVKFRGYAAVYPDMTLYQEILFLQHHAPGQWVVENVDPYYEALIPAQEIQRHLFWANFRINPRQFEKDMIYKSNIGSLSDKHGFDLTKYKLTDKRQVLRNCVSPELGLHVLNAAQDTHYHAKGIELVALDLGLL